MNLNCISSMACPVCPQLSNMYSLKCLAVCSSSNSISSQSQQARLIPSPDRTLDQDSPSSDRSKLYFLKADPSNPNGAFVLSPLIVTGVENENLSHWIFPALLCQG